MCMAYYVMGLLLGIVMSQVLCVMIIVVIDRFGL